MSRGIENLIDDYRERGWAVVNDVFTPQEVREIADIAEELAWREFRAATDHTPVTVDSGQGVEHPRKLDWAFPKHRAFQRFALDERLIELVTALLGQPGFLLRDQVFLKPARIGSVKPWHQDQPHLMCEPVDHVIAAWIALDDADDSNGCLRYVTGSHRGPVLTHRPMPGAEHNAILDAAQAREQVEWHRRESAPAAAGSVVFHHPLTLHNSRPNRSGRPRRAYSTHWATANVTCPHDHTLEWAYSRTLGACRHAVAAP